jgi:hypothetical protein
MLDKETREYLTKSITKYMFTTINTHWEATQRVVAAKFTRLTHKIAIQLHIFAENCTICSSLSRRPVRKRLDTPSYLFTYLLTYSVVQDIPWKADSQSTCQTVACFLYGTRRFITIFTKASHWIPITLRSILMLSSHLHLGLTSGLSSSVLLLNASPLPHACHVSRPPQAPWFNQPNNIRWRIQAVKFSIMQFPLRSIW